MSSDSLAGLVLAHGYVIVFLAVALDCAALPIPGELLLLTIGGLAVQGHLHPVRGIAGAAAGVIIADSLGYWMGRLGGHRVVARVRLRQRWAARVAAGGFRRVVIGEGGVAA